MHLYRKAPFTDDGDRVEHLLGLYEQLTAPLMAQAVGKTRGRGRASEKTVSRCFYDCDIGYY